MTYSEMSGALRAVLLAAAVALPGAAASAQEATAPAEVTDSPWMKVCDRKDPANPRCNVTFVRFAPNGTLLASFALETLPNNKVSVGTYVPLGFVIPAGVSLVIDGERKATANFTICLPPTQEGPAGCAANTEVDASFVDSLRRGNTLAVVLANTNGQAIPIEMTLVGFSKTFDSEGIDPMAARAAEVEQSQALQDQARAAFQRMVERQQAESGAN